MGAATTRRPLITSKNMKTGLHTTTPPDTLVTGATGLLGRWLVPALTARGRHVAVAMRDPDRRAPAYRAWVADHDGDPDLLTFVPHDLDDPTPLPWRLDSVRDVYHLAARFDWHLPLALAREANVGGSLRVLRWAAQLPHLRRVVQISGYRVSIPADTALAGAYERSKREAHAATLALADQLGIPLTTLNPASVIGHSASGETTQLLGLGAMLGQLAHRRLPISPGDRRTFIPLIPVDLVAAFAAAVVERPEAAGQQYWLLDEQTPALHDLLRAAARQLHVRPPLLSAPVSLLRWLPERLLGSPRETLEFIAPDRYDASPARQLAAAMGLAWPSIHHAWPRWLDFLASRGFEDTRLAPR
jgi:dihydroflavonol-4-reductase